MTDLLELAERCEKATGPDRELDEEITKLLKTHVQASLACHRYTASLDAAMTLVPSPEGYRLFRYSVGRDSAKGRPYAKWIWGNDETRHVIRVMGIAKSEALAVCAAALRARAA